MPPHCVLKSASVRVENEGLLVEIARLVRELLDLFASAEDLVY